MVIVLMYMYRNRGMKSVVGDDGYLYVIRSNSNDIVALKTLTLLRKKLVQLVDYIYRKVTTDPTVSRYKEYVQRIKDRLPYVQIRETSPYSNYTSYSVNKGEELHMCIRSKQSDKFHSINELIYVAIHEIAHIGCPEIGHTKLFFDINVFLLKQAMEFNIYQYINYDTKPMEYCGISLNHTVLN